MPKPKVTSSRGRTDRDTLCESCDRIPRMATRERVRQHVANSGHVAHFVIRDITTYYPPEKTDA